MTDYTTTTTTDDITTAYRAADRTEKARMRADVTDAITTAVGAGDIAAAQHAVALRDAMTVDRKSTVEVDYAGRIADHAATLRAALDAIESGAYVLPDGVTVDVSTVDFGAGVASDVSRYVSVSGRKSGRGSVSDYIASVVTSDPMTIAAMRAAFVASDDYPTTPPSAGAIGAALVRDDDDRYAAVDIAGVRGAVAV
jgi:hypothetical protein